MADRSNIKLVGNTTMGQNLGIGAGVFKCKVNGTTLQFKTLAATGTSIQIFNRGNDILISGGTSASYWSKTGNCIYPTTSTDYIRLADTKCYTWATGAFIGSTSGNGGTTNCIGICNNKGGLIAINHSNMTTFQGIGIGIHDNANYDHYMQIQPTGEIFMCTKDGNGGNISLTAQGKTDTTKGCAIIFCGGNNSSTGLGGDVCVRGGLSTNGTGGNVYLDVYNNNGINRGCIIFKGLCAKSTETCVIYVDANGKISTGIVSGGTGGGIGWSNAVNGATIAGCCTIASNATVNQDTYYGVSAGTSTTGVGSGNIGIGYRALMKNTNGCYNTSIGWNTLKSNTNGNNNMGVGACVLTNNTLGSCNVGVGFAVLQANVTGSTNVAIGSNILASNLCGNNNTGIGYGILNSNCRGCNNIGIGNTVLATTTTGCYNIGLGIQVLHMNATGCNNIGMGQQTLFTSCGSGNIGFGCQTIFNNTTGNCNIAIGGQALYGNKTGCQNIVIGTGALYTATGTSCNIAMGFGAMNLATAGVYNVAIGINALCNTRANADNNVAIGFNTLRLKCCGEKNVGIGFQAMCGGKCGNENIGIGNSVMYYYSGGSFNIGIGSTALYGGNTTVRGGDCNIMIGNCAGNTLAVGDNNIGIGSCVLYNITNSIDNIAIGRGAGCSSSGCYNVFIGNGAGCAETGSNKLIVANTNTCSLIYGEFDHKYVEVRNALAIPYAALTSGATVSWDLYTGINKTLCIGRSFTLSMSNLRNGMSGDLRLCMVGSGGTITLPTSKLNGSVSSLAAGAYHLAFVYDGTNLDFNIAQYS